MIGSLYIVVILVVSIAGYAVKSLSKSGAIATFITGCLVSIGFGWRGLLILGVFFVTSSEWSDYKKQKKKELEDIHEKGSSRDWVQVAANGSVACLSSVLFYLTGNDLWQIAFLISVAASNSDTWASEIGVLSKRDPYHIVTLKKVRRGTSGAISGLGTAAALSGSLLIAACGYFLFSLPSILLVGYIAACGFAGCLADTVLGATLQAKRQCASCGIATEKRLHCGQETVLYNGLAWLTNDGVNMVSILSATVMGTVILYWL